MEGEAWALQYVQNRVYASSCSWSSERSARQAAGGWSCPQLGRLLHGSKWVAPAVHLGAADAAMAPSRDSHRPRRSCFRLCLVPVHRPDVDVDN